MLLFFALVTVHAQSVFKDPDFGDNGRFNHQFGIGDGILHAVFPYIAVPHYNGKVLVFGIVGDQQAIPSAVRCNENGTLDGTFADNGEWSGSVGLFPEIQKVTVQPDHKILVGAWSMNPLTIQRLLPDGSPDPSFGNNGLVQHLIIPTPYGLDAKDIEVLADGKMLVSAGITLGDAECVIFRLNPNGTLSNGFGSFSKVTIKAAEFGYVRITTPFIGVTADNKIIVAGGLTTSGLNTERGFLRRYTASGQIDSTFGQNGSTTFETVDIVGDVNILSNGQFIIRTKKKVGNEKLIAVTRWNADGTIDSTYGENGYAIYPSVSSQGRTFLQPDEKVILFDYYDPPGAGRGAMAIRFKQNGQIDSTFGINGRIRSFNLLDSAHRYDLMHFESGYSLSNEQFIVAGRTYNGDTLVVARYIAGQSVGVVDAPSVIGQALMYPNPVYTPSVSLEYELLESGTVEIELFDATGRMLATLLRAPRQSGKHTEVLMLPAGATSGIYYLNIRGSRGNAFVKFVLKGDR